MAIFVFVIVNVDVVVLAAMLGMLVLIDGNILPEQQTAAHDTPEGKEISKKNFLQNKYMKHSELTTLDVSDVSMPSDFSHRANALD